MDLDLPYRTDYAFNAGECNKCQKTFLHGELRIAEMVQSKRQDAREPHWNHIYCFFELHHPKSTDEFENFENIKSADQLTLLTKLDVKFNKLKNVQETKEQTKSTAITNFGIEYSSTSNEDKCHVCKENIARNELRIKKVVYNTEIALKYGKEILWNHWYCFVMEREFFDFQLSGRMLPGFVDLQREHKKCILEALPCTLDEEELNKMFKASVALQEEKRDEEMTLEETIADQNTELMRVREALQKESSKNELQLLLSFNDSDSPETFESILDRCADFLTFGALYKCQKCFKGDMVFEKYGYQCNGMIDEWFGCENFEIKPLRLKCFIPDELKKNIFFATCEPAIIHRAVRPIKINDEDNYDLNQNAAQNTAQKQVTSVKLKDGSVVDPKSMLENVAHVYKHDEVLYSAVLGLTDIKKNKNSYFTLQVLESDKNQLHKSFWLFNSWGRTGTDIGDSKVEPCRSAAAACAKFEELYREQTGNKWCSEYFKKFPGKFYPVEVNYSDDIITYTNVASRLSHEVEELMKLLFNVQNMKRAMQSFQLDLEKMPLGKLSVRQLQSAYTTLSDLEDAFYNGAFKSEVMGLSNKFYTQIPHNFGLAKAPIIDTLEKINDKRDMVDSLLDIESAFAIMTQTQADNQDVNSFDAYYQKLNADIEALNCNSKDFQLIQQYTQNTQVHGYKLQVDEVFKVNRRGERQRYKPFEHLHNRMLLWHGSSLTNFVSIISNGLKISPQANGSMFGRGVYFADMVSKSAQYCRGANNNSILLALSEVALGNMLELNQAKNIVQPPPGKNSVKGVGQTQPDPQLNHVRPDGVIIPLGKPLIGGQRGYGALNYNEYIVYNEAQINMQYLVKMTMH